MTSTFVQRLAVLPAATLLALATTVMAAAVEEIPAHRARQIEDAAPARPSAPPAKPRRVLIWVTRPHLMEKDPHKGYCIPYGTHALRTLGAKTGAFEPVVGDDLALLLPGNIDRFDAIMLNNSSGPWITPTDDDMARDEFRRHGADKAAVERVLRKSLLDYVANGGGLAALHFAIGANGHWPEFHDLLGAAYAGHPWNEEVGVRVEDPGDPLSAAFAGKDFRVADEIYQFKAPYSRQTLRVLLSLDPATTNMGARWIERKDGDFALARVKAYGKGRVFYIALGHRTGIYWDPRVLRFFLDGIQFAAGDLPAPVAPRPDRPSPVRVPGAEPAPGLPGFVALFDGKTLDGWEGDRNIWSVLDGTITGRTTADTRLRENDFLVWKDQVEDFELRLKFRMEGGNSGIYYRARKRNPGEKLADPLVGTQADFDASGRWTGVVMEYLLRNELAERGQKVVIDENGTKQVVGSLGDPAKLLETVDPEQWNDYAVTAKGGRVVLKINGVAMCELDDRDPRRLPHGWLALQVHVGPPMRVQFKDVFLRRL